MGEREENKTTFVPKFVPIPVYSSYGMSIPLFRSPKKGERKQFPFDGLMCHAINVKAGAQLLKIPKMGVWIFAFLPREGLVLNHGYKARTKFITRGRDWF